MTIYGLYAREHGGWFSVGSLIRLMAGLGADEPAVRSAISRLKRRGILDQQRRAGLAGYGLSPAGLRTLAEGDRRIFGRSRASLSDGWVLAVFSVPESQRKQRHALRSRLTWLGFGTVSAGVWIAPGHLAGETAEVLEHSGLSGYVSLFRADYLAFGDVARQVGQWWDLDRLQGMYQEFRDAYIPLTGARTQNDAAAFAGYVKMLTDWRRLPFLDPGLPAELLPAHWQGSAAADLFAQLRTLLDAPARRHVRAVVAESRS
ncbi:MAG TPA: PaaX family transcriptional regulator C-terminal domain-containing protein [Streptosporangiaceae bacterium]